MRAPGLGARTQPESLLAAAHASKSALLAALCSASLLSSPPALALPPTIDEAIVEMTEASYPIIAALEEPGFPSFGEKVGKLLLGIDSKRLGKAIDLGLDVYATVPPEKITTFNGQLKEAFSGLSTDSCTLVPLPPASLVQPFKAIAAENVDAAKLKAFGDAWGATLPLLSKTDSAICLPPVETLDKLALAQAEVGKSFGLSEGKAFASYTGAMLKSSVTLSQALPVLESAKAQAPDATSPEKLAFQRAGKKIEAAAKREAEVQALARAKLKAASSS
jgi:hypothetical protein